ncbi:MAG: hypothetical protein LBU83_11595 [Bacteroidales bacterium]|jgi:uncharacterized BrkB/YihY/UPF0761 family membrane protein|nr:hypothetical protein [Bacteroidales bacterium]
MNKKVNTLLFVLGATLFNIIVTIACFFALIILYIRFVIPSLPEESHAIGFAPLFMASIVITFLIYRVVLKKLIKKYDFEKYFDNIFVRKITNKN